MGCSASKASEVVVPMPTKSSPQEENQTKELRIEAEETTTKKPIQVKQRSNDSLHGSQCSLNSNSDSGRSDRESSARSTRTTDSGLGELEDDPNIITERSSSDKQKIALVEERPPTPGQFTLDFRQGYYLNYSLLAFYEKHAGCSVHRAQNCKSY